MKQIPKVWFNLFMVGLIGFVGLVGCDSSVSSDAFLEAAYKGDKATIEAYIENGGDVNVRTIDEVQSTALHLAASRGHDRCVKVLLENGANVKAKNGGGNTPLQVAKTDEIKQLLIKAMK